MYYQGPLTVTVKTLHGKSLVVQTWGYRSVLDLKAMLGKVLCLYSEDMHLIYREQRLHNSLPLGVYMKDTGQVTLVPRLVTGLY